MKTNEIRKMSVDEITKKIEELKSELFDMRMKQATAALEKSHKINEDRKTIARLKTVLAEKMVEEGGEQ